jgi:methylmalonyl-CoA mutase
LKEHIEMNKIDLKTIPAFEVAHSTEQIDVAERMTNEGFSVKSTYTLTDVANIEHTQFTSGFAPYLGGPYASMYVSKPWTIRQYAGFSTAEESNAFYRRNLAAGQKGLSVAFDLATHRGYDSEHETLIRPNSIGRNVRFHDHEWSRFTHHGFLHCQCFGTRREFSRIKWDHSE